MICAIAAYQNMELSQVDVQKAYLNARSDETIYMEQPEGFTDKKHPDYVCCLNRALYGTMQAGNAWWKELDSTYQKTGHSRSSVDKCVHVKVNEGKLTIMATYTDNVT